MAVTKTGASPHYRNSREKCAEGICRGVKIAPGSDAGAYRVLHGKGIQDEMEAFEEILGKEKKVYDWLAEGEAEIRRKFSRQ